MVAHDHDSHSEQLKVWDSDQIPNRHTIDAIISSITIGQAYGYTDRDPHHDSEMRTDLDSHANMPVVGSGCYIVGDTGKTVDVSPFTPDYDNLKDIPVVDAVIMYVCPYTGKEALLVVRNALYVPSMTNNLIPPFMIREAGVVLNDTPKIHVKDPTVDDHAIMFPADDFRIPLKLYGIFSYFPTFVPTQQQVQESTEVYIITPEHKWNPHDQSYSHNEDSMLDWEGNIKDPRDRDTIMISDIPTDPMIASVSSISDAESRFIQNMYSSIDAVEPVAFSSLEVSVIYDDDRLSKALSELTFDDSYKASVGSTIAYEGDFLFDGFDGNARVPHELINDSQDEYERVRHSLDNDKNFDLDSYMAAAAHARPSRNVTAERLSKVWRIDLETAKRTIDITTQNSAREIDPKLSRNYSTNDKMIRYTRLSQHFFMDTFMATRKAHRSTRGNTCCQLFVSDKGYIYVVPMATRSMLLHALKQFVKEVGAPEIIICDHSGEQSSDNVKQYCSDIGTSLRYIEEGTPWANKAELYIGLLKEAVRKDMKESDCPLVLWDYCVERRARISNLSARKQFSLHGLNSYTSLTSEEGDISNLCQFSFYDWCYFRDQGVAFPFNKEVLGRVLGPATGQGNEMAQWILKANGRVVPRRSCRPLNTSEIYNSSEIRKRKVFNDLIRGKLGDSVNPPSNDPTDSDNDQHEDDDEFEYYQDEQQPPRDLPEHEDAIDSKGHLINQQPVYDKMINAEVQLQNNGELSLAKVLKRSIGPDGFATGEYNDDPRLNSMIYEVEFSDGQIKEYAANVIAENIMRRVDHEGYSTALMAGIVDYHRDDSVAIPKSDRWVITKRGGRRLRRSTVGWKLLVQWNDGSETWVPLKDMKESHPVETAEFAKSRGIDDEVAFAYWVPYTLKKRNAIIAAVKYRCRKATHKFGILVPTSVEEAYEFDSQIGPHCTFWRDAIALEMRNVGIAFQILEDGEVVPPGWVKATGHLIFDVKMDMTRKARWVLDGHKTAIPQHSTYAGVVSRESVRIALTYAALNRLDVTAADIRNAYLQAPSSEKHYIICGPEFGIENVGKKALIKRALYGGKSAGRDFRNHLRECMIHLDFLPCPADPDVWLRPAKKGDGSTHYEYVLLYTDDVLVISENGEKILREGIGKYFELKESSIGPPNIYLGGKLRKVTLDNGAEAWAFGSSKYVQESVKNVQRHLAKRQLKLPTRAETPIQTSYRPELDVTPLLSPTDASYYQSLVGMLRWMVELGRVDICLEVSMMSSYLAMPRQGHLNQLYHIFAYLSKHYNAEMVFDPSDPIIKESDFTCKDWTTTEFGHVVGKELLPPNMIEPRGMGFCIRAKVDADHAGDTATRRSRTGFIVYINSAPVYWLSKKQPSVESSSFGSEFVAMRSCCEYLRGLRYKLRMMGIPILGYCHVYGDNQSVLANTSVPESVLKKKSQSIAYHYVREGVARNEWRTAYVNTKDNEADLLTKVMSSGEKRRGFVRNILHYIFAVFSS